MQLPFKFTFRLPRFNQRKFWSHVSQYLLEYILMPWIILWGYGFICSLIFVVGYMRGTVDANTGISPIATDITVLGFWYVYLGFLFLNFNVGYGLRKWYPKSRTLLLLASIFITVLSFILLLPALNLIIKNLI
jgi:hypothetical protein